MRLACDRHFETSVNLSTWAIACRLSSTLAQAVRLGWRTDRCAILALLTCQITAVALTTTALAATTRVLAAMFTQDDIVTGLRNNTTAVVVLAVAASGHYLLDAAARAFAVRLAPKAVREADLKVITAATAAELVAYEDPGFEDAHAAACDGADKTGELILDVQLLTAAAAQMAAAAVVTVLHPVMLPLLVCSVIPCAWGAVRAARIEHAAHHRNPADSRLRNVFRSYTTERNTADEVRSDTMAAFLIRQYRITPAAWRPNTSRRTSRHWWCRGSATRSPLSAPPRPGAYSYCSWPAAAWGWRRRGRLPSRCGSPAPRSRRRSGQGPGCSAPRCPWTTGPGSWRWPSRGQPAAVRLKSPKTDRR